MDRITETTSIIKSLNKLFRQEIADYEFINYVCLYFDSIKNEELTPSDLKFLKYISNIAGIPHYYDLLFNKFGHKESFNSFALNTISSMIYESTLHVDENIKIHKYQKKILNQFEKEKQNRFFLSATTSFGKTFLIYEIIKKMNYKNVVLIFPTIALLSENFEKITTHPEYNSIYENFSIHTLSEIDESDIGKKNLFIYTPERYLSFLDMEHDFEIDFVFIDEIYKVDNEYIIDQVNKENERDTAYRIALHHVLNNINDVLLVGPYIEFPDINNTSVNQSFNKFLDSNEFKTIDYNKYDIVNKGIHVIGKGGLIEIDDQLTLDLRGFSSKKEGERLAKVISDITEHQENVIVYSSGPTRAESLTKNIIEDRQHIDLDLSGKLKTFIDHLKSAFNVKDWIIISALENKIGIHHGLVPKYIQKEIIDLFNNGDIDVLVSTTTITEGVNTSAKNLVVNSASKGGKPLKTFDAKNIAGRAGRFLHHYTGRVIVLKKEFNEVLHGSDSEIKHKNYDEKSTKDEIDYFITNEEYLNDNDRKKRQEIKEEQEKREIPNELMQMFKVVSHSDKIVIYDRLLRLRNKKKYRAQYKKLREFINNTSVDLKYFTYVGFELVLLIIGPIIKDQTLKRLVDQKINGRSLITYLLRFYLRDGFMGSVNYKRDKHKMSSDEAIRETARFVFNTLKYQLVKYLGVFNIMYKFIESTNKKIAYTEVPGLEKLLLKLEYNAVTEAGRLASDYGVPSKIIEYYDNEEDRQKIQESFDNYELEKFQKIETILHDKFI